MAGLGIRLDSDEAVEEVGDDRRPLVGEEPSNEASENSLSGSEDHLLEGDDLKKSMERMTGEEARQSRVSRRGRRYWRS